MNKTELIAAVAEKADLSKKDAEAAITAAVEAITGALIEGEKVQLVGFGSFEVKERAARIEKRKKLFARIEKLPKFELPEGFPSTAELIRQGHEERDRRTLGAVGFDDGYGEVITR